MSVSKFTFEIRKYIVIDKTNYNKETHFSKSPTNIAINYSACRHGRIGNAKVSHLPCDGLNNNYNLIM